MTYDLYHILCTKTNTVRIYDKKNKNTLVSDMKKSNTTHTRTHNTMWMDNRLNLLIYHIVCNVIFYLYSKVLFE